MSSSSDGGSMLSVESDPGVSIAIYDAAGVELRRAERAVELALPSGLYQVQLERAGRLASRVVVHRGDTTVRVEGPPLETPVLIRGAATSHEYYTDPTV